MKIEKVPMVGKKIANFHLTLDELASFWLFCQLINFDYFSGSLSGSEVASYDLLVYVYNKNGHALPLFEVDIPVVKQFINANQEI